MDVLTALSEIYREAREDAGLTRTQVAAVMGKAESAVWRFESPKHGWPAGAELDRTVAAYADQTSPPKAADIKPGPPPGWYTDGNHPGQRRWWDGQGWTDHVHPPG